MNLNSTKRWRHLYQEAWIISLLSMPALAACPQLSGRYEYEGEDNGSIWVITQDGCRKVTVTDSAFPGEKLELFPDGKFRALNSPLIGSGGDCTAKHPCTVASQFAGLGIEVSWRPGVEGKAIPQKFQFFLDEHQNLIFPGFEQPAKRKMQNTDDNQQILKKVSLDTAIGPSGNDVLTRQHIQRPEEWLNPWIEYTAQDLVLTCRALSVERRHLAPDQLEGALINLPVAAWPFGRIAAIVGPSIAEIPDKDAAARRRNAEKVEATLKKMGVKFIAWPTG